MIDSKIELERVVKLAQKAGVVAVDTEFVWETTYYAELGVVQLGLSRDEVYLIDAIELDDLSPLGILMEDASTTKVLHDAVQDLNIIRQRTGCFPQTVFDTQWLSGLVGLSATLSLQDLIEHTCQIVLKKGETRTNWLRRPLKETQITYAEDDVRFLIEAYSWLKDAITAMGREEWAGEEMSSYNNPGLYRDPDPDEQYRRVKGRGVHRLSGRQKGVLKELAAWREEVARSNNLTRKKVVDDNALVVLAQRPPKKGGNPKVKPLSQKQWEQHSAGILQAIDRAQAIPDNELPQVHQKSPNDELFRACTQVLQALVWGNCKRYQVDERIVATKKELYMHVESVLTGNEQQALSLSKGWRKEFIGNEINGFLQGKGGLKTSVSDHVLEYVDDQR